MIDINELRMLMQSATPGPWEVYGLDQNGQAIIKGEHIEIATCWHHCVGSIEKEMHANAAFIAAANPAAISELLDRLETAEKDAAHQKALAESALRVAEGWEEKCNTLRAKIEAMEKQKPVGWQVRSRPTWNDGTWHEWRKCSECSAQDIKNTPLRHDQHYEVRALYGLPGAKGE